MLTKLLNKPVEYYESSDNRFQIGILRDVSSNLVMIDEFDPSGIRLRVEIWRLDQLNSFQADTSYLNSINFQEYQKLDIDITTWESVLESPSLSGLIVKLIGESVSYGTDFTFDGEWFSFRIAEPSRKLDGVAYQRAEDLIRIELLSSTLQFVYGN